MDKLAKDAYENHTTYLYKGKEEVAPLEMVDDILVPIECGHDSFKANIKVNNFIESKKLQKKNILATYFLIQENYSKLLKIGELKDMAKSHKLWQFYQRYRWESLESK